MTQDPTPERRVSPFALLMLCMVLGISVRAPDDLEQDPEPREPEDDEREDVHT